MKELVVRNIQEFMEYLDSFQEQFRHGLRNDTFVLRGISDNKYKLLPSAFRQFEEPQVSKLTGAEYIGDRYNNSENERLFHFKKEASVYIDKSIEGHDLEWLLYAQHYGMPTRLLDFTTNPLIALFFCCLNNNDVDGAVWIINTASYQKWMCEDDNCKSLENTNGMIKSIIDYIHEENNHDEEKPYMNRPVIFFPQYIDQRMAAQSSVFMIWGTDKRPLEEMIKTSNKMEVREGVSMRIRGDTRFIANITVPANCKHRIIKQLDIMNVNEKTVFPGLDGIGRYLEKYYRNNPDDMSIL